MQAFLRKLASRYGKPDRPFLIWIKDQEKHRAVSWVMPDASR